MQDIPYDASHVPIDYDDPVDVSLESPHSTTASRYEIWKFFIRRTLPIAVHRHFLAFQHRPHF